MKRNVDALADETFDLLILGGGITGAGVALDAAVRGFRVALIDKGDFASGTSSVSSKLVHGGLRYLEHGDLRLVYEALAERRRLLHNAPHLVRPLRFLLPVYEKARVRPWQWRLGLTLYDLLAGRGNIRRSKPLRRRRLLCEVPLLQSAGLVGAAEYYDAQMDDARLCLEVIKTAVEHGACAANYVEAIAFEKQAGILRGVRAIDHVGQRELFVQARQVLNATGPWVDHVRRLAGEQSEPYLQPTKGAHIVVRNLGLGSAFLLLHPADGRVFFVLPWLGKTLIGTTDTFAEGPDVVRVLPAEISYLLEGYNRHFAVPMSERDVLGSFAGLRPLLRAREGDPSARSREFRLFTSPAGLTSVAGGKYTTYRHMAEVIVDEIARRLGRRRGCRTHDLLLEGAPRQDWGEFFRGQVAELGRRFVLSPEAAAHLVNRYGCRAADVARYVERVSEGRLPIVPGEPDLRGELAYQRAEEMALFADDFYLRRTRLGLFGQESRSTIEQWLILPDGT